MDSGELPTVRERGRQGRLLRDDVETYAVDHFRPGRYRQPGSYFVTTAGGAEILGGSRPRVIQLGDKGFLPYLVTRNGWRLYRRHQVAVIANSRMSRGFRVALGVCGPTACWLLRLAAMRSRLLLVAGWSRPFRVSSSRSGLR